MTTLKDSQPRPVRGVKIGICAAAIGGWLGGHKIEGGGRVVGRHKNLNLTGEKWRASCPCCEAPLAVEDVRLGKVAFHSLCACGTENIVASLKRRKCWPSDTIGVDPDPSNPRPKAEKRPTEPRVATDSTPGPFVKLRLAVLGSVAAAVLSPLARWVLWDMMHGHASPRARTAEPFVRPLAQLDRCGKRREAVMAALRELEALKLVEITHGKFDRHQGQRQSNLYRLTFAGMGCSDAWRAFEPDGDSGDARRDAEAAARTAVADAEAKAAGARADRNRRRASRRPWAAPAPIPQPDEWAEYEPDEAAAGPLESPHLGDAGLLETQEFELPTSSGAELVHEFGEGTTNKSPGGRKDSREVRAEYAAPAATDEPAPAGVGDAELWIVTVEGLGPPAARLADGGGGKAATRGTRRTAGRNQRGEELDRGPMPRRELRLPGVRLSPGAQPAGQMACPLHAQAQEADGAAGETQGRVPASPVPAGRPCCLRPPDVGSAFGATHFRGHRNGGRGRTRDEALAHFARLGLIVLDSGRTFHPGYR